MSHTCPVRACKTSVPDDRVICPRHWRRVTAVTAREFYASYRALQGAIRVTKDDLHRHTMTAASRHTAAMKAAVVEAEGPGPRVTVQRRLL